MPCIDPDGKLSTRRPRIELFALPAGRTSRSMETVPAEQELWARLIRGDAAAFEAFYRAHAGRLRSFLWQCLGNGEAAEELTQETFALLWERPNGFDPARGTLPAYLFGIARNRALHWREKKRESDGASFKPTPGTSAEPTHLITDAMSRIEPDSRALLWLREVEGYSYAELAEILSIPLGTVKSRLFSAREELRCVWRGPGGEEER
jgi:RNA polymerase sigma-70 factor (ECF subfamily)